MPPERLPARRRLNGARLLKASSRSVFSCAAPARHVVDVGVEVEVLHHGQVGVEPETLAHVADLLLDRLGLADDVMAGHPGVAAVGVHDRRQQPHGGGLAGAVGPDQAEDFPLGHVEVQIVHRGQVAERLRQVFRADHFKDEG